MSELKAMDSHGYPTLLCAMQLEPPCDWSDVETPAETA
jgi:hypothetical protein